MDTDKNSGNEEQSPLATDRQGQESQLQGQPTHTSGPWRMTTDAGHPANIRITATSRRHVAKVYAESVGRDLVCEANARLIIAAPGLLRSLSQLMDELPERRDWLDPVLEREIRYLLGVANGRATATASAHQLNKSR